MLVFIFSILLIFNELEAQNSPQIRFGYLQNYANIAQAPQNKENASFENVEIDSLEEELQRRELLRKEQIKRGDMRVAFLGNSALDVETGFNAFVLRQLLAEIKEENPRAVFYTGNPVFALEKKPSNPQGIPVTLTMLQNVFGQKVSERKGYFNFSLYESRLAAFAQIVKEELGNIPFYPAPGEMEAMQPEAMELFKKQFNLQENPYSVTLDNAFFAVIPTDVFEGGKVQHRITPAVFAWLEKSLKEQAGKSRFTFVVGNDPAFSATGTFGIFAGLDQYSDERDRFWHLLRREGVRAYITGQDILYDRSYRFGVWQLITGGAGATADFEGRDDTFYHYFILSLPQNEGVEALLDAYDRSGKKRDGEPLTKQAPAISSFRISTP